MRLKNLLSLIVCLVVACASFAFADDARHKIALLIGNSAYEDSYALDDSEDNIIAMARLLAAKGFEVDSHLNLDSYAMRQVLEGFERKLQADSLVVFFFSGYASALNKVNYLIPTDVDVWSPLSGYRSLKNVSMDLRRVIYVLSHSQTQLIFIENFDYDTHSRNLANTTMGDVKLEDLRDANALISIANMNCCTGKQNLYVPALLKYLSNDTQPVQEALWYVREEVSRQSEGWQRPWVLSSVKELVYLMEQSE